MCEGVGFSEQEAEEPWNAERRIGRMVKGSSLEAPCLELKTKAEAIRRPAPEFDALCLAVFVNRPLEQCIAALQAWTKLWKMQKA